MIIKTSKDDDSYETIVEDELEQKAGEYIYDIKTEAQFVKFILTENYGGSGIHVSKVFIYGE